MVGYPESLTDPSYCAQILVLTYPLIGNYGIPGESQGQFMLPSDFESKKIWLAGLVVGDYVEEYSHWNAKKSLSQWLAEQNIPGIHGNNIEAPIFCQRLLFEFVFSDEIKLLPC